MYDRFTDRARKVMQLANQEAQRFNHEYIATEHILLGLVKEGSGVAAKVFENLAIDLRKIRLEIEKICPTGPDRVTSGKLPPTPRAKKVIEYAVEEARSLNHNYVGTEHLLLGLLRDQETVAAQLLMNLGLKLEDVRENVLNLLGHSLSASEASPPPAKIPLVLDWLAAFMNLPQEILQSLKEINDHIEKLTQEKEEAVACHDFDRAAAMRDKVDGVKQSLIDTMKTLKAQILGPEHESRGS